MARDDYQTIDTGVWTDPYFIDLPNSDYKLFFIILCANRYKNTTGIYEIHPKVMADLCGFSIAKCKKMLEKFAKDGRIFYESGFIILKNRKKHTTFNNESVQSFVIDHLTNVIPNSIKDNHSDIINTMLEMAGYKGIREPRTENSVNHIRKERKEKESLEKEKDIKETETQNTEALNDPEKIVECNGVLMRNREVDELVKIMGGDDAAYQRITKAVFNYYDKLGRQPRDGFEACVKFWKNDQKWQEEDKNGKPKHRK